MVSSSGIDALTQQVPMSWRERVLVSKEYSWLFFVQVVSALGDWVGLFAIAALAATISGAPEAAIALVLTARVAPSFFIGPFMGVLVDRYDRKVLMRIADVARALIFALLPFVNSVWGLILASLLLETFTLMWSPAKEALVPSLVPRGRLTTANSLGILAAYGTMPLAGVIQFGLKKANDALESVSWLEPLGFHREIGQTQAAAFYFNSLTFLTAAFIVWRCIRTSGAPTPAASDDPPPEGVRAGFRKTFVDIRDGFRFIAENPTVRAVNVGLAAGLLGGAMLVPLGTVYARYVIGDANAFSLYITALGFGVALGVATLTAWQQRIPKERVFVAALFLGGVSILFGVTMSTFWLSAIGVFGLGLGAGSVYVLGYTLLQEHTADDLRGRTFTTFLTLVRLCVLGALMLGPLLSGLADQVLRKLIDQRGSTNAPVVQAFGVQYALPGVRVALWIGGLLIIAASILAARSIDLRFRQNLRTLGGDVRRANGDST
jgi:dTMP kinase